VCALAVVPKKILKFIEFNKVQQVMHWEKLDDVKQESGNETALTVQQG